MGEKVRHTCEKCGIEFWVDPDAPREFANVCSACRAKEKAGKS